MASAFMCKQLKSFILFRLRSDTVHVVSHLEGRAPRGRPPEHAREHHLHSMPEWMQFSLPLSSELAHMRLSSPDAGTGLQVKVLKTCQGFASSLERETSGDTTPCKVAPVILHGVIFPNFTRLCPQRTRKSRLLASPGGLHNVADLRGMPPASHM